MARGCIATFSPPAQISTVPAPAATCTVLVAQTHGTPSYAPSHFTYPSRLTLRSSRRYGASEDLSGSRPSTARSIPSLSAAL